MTRAPIPARPEPDPIRVGSFFLETLTTGMYEDPFHSIREYVQNGLDAIQDAVRQEIIRTEEGEILITIGGTTRAPSLTIRDNGTGIAQADAYSTLVSLGASRKTPTRHAGFRGIGRLGGIAYCNTLRFKTKARGEPVATIVEWDCGRVRSYFAPGADPVDVRDVVRASVKTKTVPEPEASHFTEVEMVHLVDLGVEFVDLTKLQPYLRQVCPVEYADNFDFADQIRDTSRAYGDKLPVVRVDVKQRRERLAIHKPYKRVYPTSRRNAFSTLHHLEVVTRKDHGWYGWIGVSNFPGEIVDDTAAGVRFRVKNIQVGDSGLIEELAAELTTGGTERRLQRWAVGEIFITSTEVVPNARRDGFEDSAAWRAIRNDIKEQVVKRIIKLIRSASSTRSAMNSFAEAVKRIGALLERPTLTTIEKSATETEIRKHLAALTTADSKLPGADPKEVTALISKFKELNEQLAKAVIQDPVVETPDEEPEEAPDLEAQDDGGDDEDEPGDDEDGDGESEPEGSADEPADDDGGASSEEPGAKTDLDIVREVLTAELGGEEADRLMGLIDARLASR